MKMRYACLWPTDREGDVLVFDPERCLSPWDFERAENTYVARKPCSRDSIAIRSFRFFARFSQISVIVDLMRSQSSRVGVEG